MFQGAEGIFGPKREEVLEVGENYMMRSLMT
jgi:hypothetical protein